MQKEHVIWHPEGQPVSSLFDDPYFSLQDGAAEARHVFVDGNQLGDRMRDGFQVAELGFGTGLNALITWQAWTGMNLPGAVKFTSFEAHPMPADDMARALSAWDQLRPMADQLVAGWAEGKTRFSFQGLQLDVIIGDARSTLPHWQGKADAWYLDGFSPAKNPELWTADLMAEVAAHTQVGGTAATYSAAGHVRRKLEDAGFTVSRQKGYGRKRHMTRAHL